MSKDVRPQRVAIVNCYLARREEQCERNEFPRNHLWGGDYLAKMGSKVQYIYPRRDLLLRLTIKIGNFAKGRLGNIDFDVEMLRRAREFDVIYAPYGHFLLCQLAAAFGLLKAPIVYWVYSPPHQSTSLNIDEIWWKWPFNRGIGGILCLTSAAAAGFQAKWPKLKVAHIEWTPDNILFPGSEANGEFYFACGRTNRDYKTLVAAAAKLDVPFVIVASPSLMEGLPIPPNVRFVEGPPSTASDRGGVPFPELISYYANAKALCIPLQDIPADTSGYTNVLEAMAMYRPILMTQTGTLDLDIEKEGLGRWVEPDSVDSWVQAIQEMEAQPELRKQMRERAKSMIEETYNLDRHGKEVADFLSSLT